MRWSFRIARVAGIDVKIHLTFLLLLAWIGFAHYQQGGPEAAAQGILFILFFAVGHCLPIVVAGSSAAAVKKVVENSAWQGAGNWFRKGAGVVIVMLGAYFIVNPFFLLLKGI